ncbi:MAG: DNA polymerase/3'-5' exonuclease PolX [Bacteroidetes bacterium]|nr:DNA polymerase/3'-5' exonuclease PolX [Bacteroidota bacterium]
MTSRDVAKVLYSIETYLELHGDTELTSKSYGRAARSLETSNVDVVAMVHAGLPVKAPGIGSTLGAVVREIVETGTTAQLEELRRITPPGLMEILEIRGVGAKKVRALHTQLGIETLDQLEQAALENRIAALPGFGDKSQAKILEGLSQLRQQGGKLRINRATELAESVLARLRELPSVERGAIAGRLRRGGEEFDSLGFVLQAASVDALERDLASIADILSEPVRNGSLITAQADGGFRVRIDAATPANYAVLLHQRTGASDYCFMVSIPLTDRGYDLREDGLYRDGEMVMLDSEDELFDLAGMQYITPELREGIDEVRSALDGGIPDLVTREDLKGMIHVHSTWSDGRSPIQEIAEHVHGLGYGYLLITDHSKSAFYANGLDERRLEAQGREIDEINRRYDPSEFRVLKGIECDILADGALDLEDDALAALDAVVVSVHSQFNLPMEAQTDRICRALEHRYSTILGHSTGRLILKRKGYDVDLRRVIAAAAAHGKAIELNCNPMRLDLNWRMVRHARRKGVPIAINPDAHSLADFDNMRYGITMARKGWLTPDGTLNALDADGLIRFATALRG